MQDGVTRVFHLEIPSTSPVFLAIVGVHALVGIAAVAFGATAIFSRKGRGRHSRFGICYYWAVVAVIATAAVLTAMRFLENLDVMALGLLCIGALTVGRTALQRRWRNWVPIHIAGMGASYILLLTAFYVENGADLPLWDLLPPITYWLLPVAIGAPVIALALWLHPLARQSRTEAKRTSPARKNESLK
jgi:hypothetical protein